MEQNELRLVYRRKHRGIQIGSGSFFFQEGHGKIYNAARFAVLRVDAKGEALLTELLDAKQQKVGNQKNRKTGLGGKWLCPAYLYKL